MCIRDRPNNRLRQKAVGHSLRQPGPKPLWTSISAKGVAPLAPLTERPRMPPPSPARPVGNPR
eukprot:9267661-Prorocentrum_lima.AAC.1